MLADELRRKTKKGGTVKQLLLLIALAGSSVVPTSADTAFLSVSDGVYDLQAPTSRGTLLLTGSRILTPPTNF